HAGGATVTGRDGVTCKFFWTVTRGVPGGLNILIGLGEDRLGNAVDEVARERSVGYDKIEKAHSLVMARQRRIASRRHHGCCQLWKGEPQCDHLAGCQRQVSDLVSFLEIGKFWKRDASSHRKRIERARLPRRGQLRPSPASRPP